MRLWMIAPVGLALITAACGATDEQRAASGGLGGAAAGAVVGGPVGAVVGGAAGATGGLYRDEAEAEIAERTGGETPSTSAQRPQAQSAQAGEQAGQLSNEDVREAQVVLQDMGLYDGQIDGLYGPRTMRAVEQYQQRQGLPQTAALDQNTRQSLQQQTAAQPQDQRRTMDMQQRDMQQQEMDRQKRLEMQREQVQDPQVPPPPERDSGTTTR